MVVNDKNFQTFGGAMASAIPPRTSIILPSLMTDLGSRDRNTSELTACPVHEENMNPCAVNEKNRDLS